MYYFQNGASYSQTSGNIYTNFKKTAKIWWDPWPGGAGAIYSTIDSSGSGYPIAEVNNCSRIIKYVVTVGQRYSSYTLVDMRVHDINAAADLTRHNPTAPDPEESDGTAPTPECGQEEGEQTLSLLSVSLEAYWALVNFWPRLFLELVDVIETVFNVLISVDILGDIQVHTLSIASSIEAEGTEEEMGAVAQQMDSGWAEFLVKFVAPVGLAFALKYGLMLIENLASPLAMLTSIWVLLAMLGAWTVLFLAYVAFIQWAVENNVMHPYGAAAAFLSLIMLLFPGVGPDLAAGWLMYRLYKACKPFPIAPAGFNRGIWFFAVAFIKMAVMLTCAWYVGYYLAMGWST
ncbi:MAG: hypothetical protein C4K49_07675 [Candidatus Thorarchaeota archaeon]|nr:MAG: hypothetical protein C4K49_07675 [Candidatus Thorarchaeota archaeon]